MSRAFSFVPVLRDTLEAATKEFDGVVAPKDSKSAYARLAKLLNCSPGSVAKRVDRLVVARLMVVVNDVITVTPGGWQLMESVKDDVFIPPTPRGRRSRLRPAAARIHSLKPVAGTVTFRGMAPLPVRRHSTKPANY